MHVPAHTPPPPFPQSSPRDHESVTIAVPQHRWHISRHTHGHTLERQAPGRHDHVGVHVTQVAVPLGDADDLGVGWVGEASVLLGQGKEGEVF